jgi:hypothetical protein
MIENATSGIPADNLMPGPTILSHRERFNERFVRAQLHRVTANGFNHVVFSRVTTAAASQTRRSALDAPPVPTPSPAVASDLLLHALNASSTV